MGETAILAGIALAATATSTYVAVDGANKQAKGARDAAQLELNQYAEEKKAAADQAEQQMADVMRSQRAAQAALAARRGANGLDPYGAGGRVLLDDINMNAEADLESISANRGRSINRLSSGELASQLRSRSAITSANSAAMGALASGAGSLASTGYRYLSTSPPKATPA